MFKKDNWTLIIKEQEYLFHNFGAYGDIFVNIEQTRCWKLFRKTEVNMKASETFDAELRAMQLANKSKKLQVFVPSIYRNGIEFKVIDKYGKDVTGIYYELLNYEMEYIPFPFSNFSEMNITDNLFYKKLLINFRNEGINHIKDASIAKGEDSKVWLVDIAMQEFEIQWDDHFDT